MSNVFTARWLSQGILQNCQLPVSQTSIFDETWSYDKVCKDISCCWSRQGMHAKIAVYIVCWRELTILLCVRAACTQCSKSHTKPLKCHTKPQSIQELTLPLRLFKNFKFNKKPEAWPTGSLHRTSLLKRHFLSLCIFS